MVVVAAVDRTARGPPTVEAAGRIAAAFGEPVRVVHVLTRKQFVDLERTSVSETGTTVPREQVVEIATEIATETIEETDVDAEPVGLVGDPATEIVAYADREDASYLVVSGRKRSPVGKALFGSVTQEVLLEATCPVVTIRTED